MYLVADQSALMKGLASWSMLVLIEGAGQKGLAVYVLRGDSERNKNFKREC